MISCDNGFIKTKRNQPLLIIKRKDKYINKLSTHYRKSKLLRLQYISESTGSLQAQTRALQSGAFPSEIKMLCGKIHYLGIHM